MQNIHFTSISRRIATIFILLPLLFLPQKHAAQNSHPVSSTEETILELDRQFWAAYNSCDVNKMMQFVDQDVEFYHDIGGETLGREALERAMREGLCKRGKNEVERRPRPESIQVFTMAKDGAIIRGEHEFIGIKNPGEDGEAEFFHHWKRKGDTWLMTRVFSFDHQLLTANRETAYLILPPGSLEKFTGAYHAPQTGRVSISSSDNILLLDNGKGILKLHAKTPTVFFNRKLPLEFHFKLERGEATAFSVLEKGKEVEVAQKLSDKE